MTLLRRAFLFSSVIASGAAFGCVVHEHHEGPPPTEAVIYEPGYYDRGEYRDNVWYWHDREGHERHEAREEHERRMRDWPAHREEHHDEGERH